MKKLTVFYSWQSDVDRRLCRNVIQKALADAAATLNNDPSAAVQIEIDSDTQGVAGTPPISETILRKIRDCDVFAPDVTFVATTPDKKRVPNPNVMGEYGYALLAKGYGRMMPIMNTAFGPPQDLPFDMHHLRHPIGYLMHDGTSNVERRKIRADLAANLVGALRLFAKELEPPSAPVVDAERINRAEKLLADRMAATLAMSAPVLVPGPKFVLYFVASAVLDQNVDLSPMKARKLLPYLIPPDFTDAETGADADEWWSADPPRRRSAQTNPESAWCTRLFSNGVFEFSQNMGRRIDDDAKILVKGRSLEASLVGVIDQLAEAYGHIGIEGPGWLSTALLDVQDVVLAGGDTEKARTFRRPSVALRLLALDNIAPPLGTLLKPVFD
jgi:hypothetical protein